MAFMLIITLFFEVIARTIVPPNTTIRKWPYENLSYAEAMAMAGKMDKPVLFYFTGSNCVNAQKMDDHILSDSTISHFLNHSLLFVPLRVSDKTVPKGDTESLGERNAKLQIERFGHNFQPFFVMVTAEEEILGYRGFTPNKNEFLDWLIMTSSL